MKIGEWFRNEIVIKLHSGKEVKNKAIPYIINIFNNMYSYFCNFRV